MSQRKSRKTEKGYLRTSIPYGLLTEKSEAYVSIIMSFLNSYEIDDDSVRALIIDKVSHVDGSAYKDKQWFCLVEFAFNSIDSVIFKETHVGKLETESIEKCLRGVIVHIMEYNKYEKKATG